MNSCTLSNRNRGNRASFLWFTSEKTIQIPSGLPKTSFTNSLMNFGRLELSLFGFRSIRSPSLCFIRSRTRLHFCQIPLPVYLHWFNSTFSNTLKMSIAFVWILDQNLRSFAGARCTHPNWQAASCQHDWTEYLSLRVNCPKKKNTLVLRLHRVTSP